MNITEYLLLVNKPEAVHDKHTEVLEKIVQEFPYFQSARALYLKGLYNQSSFKYNYALKIAAAHTADRSVLFDFITSDTFSAVNKSQFEQQLRALAAITVYDSELVIADADAQETKTETPANSLEQSILSSIRESGQEAATAPAEVGIVADETPESDFYPMPHPELVEGETTPQVGTPLEIEAEFDAAPVTDVPQEIPEFVPDVPDEAAPPVNIVDETAWEPQTTQSQEENEEETDAIPDAVLEPETALQTAVEDSPTPQSTAETFEKLDIGKPLEFSRQETHSFQEWLQLSRFQPIDRSSEMPQTASSEALAAPDVEKFSETAVEPVAVAEASEPQNTTPERDTFDAEKQKKMS